MNIIKIPKSRLIFRLISTLILIGVFQIACASNQTFSNPTNVLQPTYTSQPTFTPQPTYTPQIPDNPNPEPGFPHSLLKNIKEIEGIKVNLVSRVGDVELRSSINLCETDGITRFVSSGESASIHSSAPNCYNASGQVQWYKIKLQDGSLHWVENNNLQEYNNRPIETAELVFPIKVIEVTAVIRDCEPYGIPSYLGARENATITILSNTPGCLNTSGNIKWFKIRMQDGSLYWIENKNLRLTKGLDLN